MSDPDPDLVPVSVRLGAVVPPEDPEDWTRPLTWVAALGMLAAPILILAWFAIGPPQATSAVPATWAAAAVLAAGAGTTGATQQGRARAWTATAAAGLFGALAIIVLGAAMAGQRQVGAASPTLAHAFVAALAGLVGTAAASLVAAIVAESSRSTRNLTAIGAGAAVAVATVGILTAG